MRPSVNGEAEEDVLNRQRSVDGKKSAGSWWKKGNRAEKYDVEPYASVCVCVCVARKTTKIMKT